MNENRAIPPGYMTVGQAAKRLGVTVRTLQYYDKEGLLSPSAQSEGGRRLYTDKDVIRLHQILSLKHLGFSLKDIKSRLPALDTPAQVANALAGQAADLREKIEALSTCLQEIELLREEVLQMQAVDFKKYADIIVNLQMKNEYYWLIKHFDSQTLDHIRSRFDKESSLAFIQDFTALQEQAVRYQKAGEPPAGEKGQVLAARFWKLITDFTGGDMSMLPKLMEFANAKGADEEWKEKQKMADAFFGPALDAYFASQGINPFQEAGL
ncbi:MAG TPA: MerR family transcriptional regulator [Firmicutes bacterium]|nr:MerR family transcriptional regulator [Bacillota bacterium]